MTPRFLFLLILSAAFPFSSALRPAAGGAEPAPQSPPAPLKIGKGIVLSGTHGGFDFLTIDPVERRLLAAHAGNETLDVIDLDREKLLATVPTGAAQGSAIDPKNHLYYVSVSQPPQLAVVDAKTLRITSLIALPGKADLVAFNPNSGLAYVCHDDDKELWVIDPAKRKLVATIDLPTKSPEDLTFGPGFDRLYQNLKDVNAIAVIDPAKNKVVSTWPIPQLVGPHGMALWPEGNALVVAGGAGYIGLVSLKDGRILSITNIPPRVDQIAVDHETRLVYSASGAGQIGVTKIEGDKLINLGNIYCSPGAHSIAVDPKTHKVWIAYKKDEYSVLEPYLPQP